MKYKLNLSRDVDVDGDPSNPDGYVLCLPLGWRFYDDIVHTRGFDNMRELKQFVKTGWQIVPCDCAECAAG
jgi:hypothetical protein